MFKARSNGKPASASVSSSRVNSVTCLAKFSRRDGQSAGKPDRQSRLQQCGWAAASPPPQAEDQGAFAGRLAIVLDGLAIPIDGLDAVLRHGFTRVSG
jgi:hypothetical protein